MNKSMHDMR